MGYGRSGAGVSSWGGRPRTGKESAQREMKIYAGGLIAVALIVIFLALVVRAEGEWLGVPSSLWVGLRGGRIWCWRWSEIS